MTITLTEKLKAAGTASPAALSLPRSPEGSEQNISFRHLSQSGEFVQSIKSVPGYVTVVQESGQETFRDALLGKQQAGRMDIRLGAQELHQSEVYLVENQEHLLKEASVRHALRAAGAPDAEIEALLKKVGLDTAADVAPRDLGLSALKRLGIACSMYARARVLLFDRPFLGADPAWIERIAQLLIQLGEANARAIIVTGETQLPQTWRHNSRVLLQDPKQQQGVITMPVRPVNGAARNGEAALVTRPQAIYQQAARSGEALQSEAIENPNPALQEMMKRLGGTASQIQREAVQSARKDTLEESPHNEYRRTRKRTLTHVTGFLRFKEQPAYKRFDEALRKVRGRISARPAELDIPPAARLLEFNKRRELQWGAAIFALAVLAMCLLGYLAR